MKEDDSTLELGLLGKKDSKGKLGDKIIACLFNDDDSDESDKRYHEMLLSNIGMFVYLFLIEIQHMLEVDTWCRAFNSGGIDWVFIVGHVLITQMVGVMYVYHALIGIPIYGPCLRGVIWVVVIMQCLLLSVDLARAVRVSYQCVISNSA